MTHEDIVNQVLDLAQSAGAEAADALVADGTALEVSVRLGEPEDLERSEGAELGLRAIIGQSQACASTSDLSPDGLKQLAERVVDMAKATPPDPYCGLAPAERLAKVWPETLDLDDGGAADADRLIAAAREAEDAARAIDGITNSEGGGASFARSHVALATSTGFFGSYSSSSHSLSVSVLAGEGTGMERDYAYDAKRHLDDMRSPEEIGQEAGERAVARLGPKKVKTAQLPVLYDRRVAGSLLGHFLGAINGNAVARGTSFLKDKLGEAVFAADIQISDAPDLPRGLRSKYFDGEGMPANRLELVKDGVLQHWLLNWSAARQLDTQSNGRATRGTGSPPGVGATNVAIAPSSLSRADMIKGVKQGLLITELIGHGVNMVTGDYSRGASGFWIEDGEISYPVSGVTVAGNLADMFANLHAADDLERRSGADAPTCLIEGMTLAGD